MAELAKSYESKADFVEVTDDWQLSEWQYESADNGERGGVIINLSPSGRVDILEGVAPPEAPQDMLDNARTLNPEFASRAADREAALRFFGNARVARGGKGHGAQLKRPLQKTEGSGSGWKGAQRAGANNNERAPGWKQRAERLRPGHRPRKGRGHKR